MLKKLIRFSGRQACRALVLVFSFAGGWAAYAWLHPKPLLQERWAALVADPKTRSAPGQGGKRADGAGKLGDGNSGNLDGPGKDPAGGKVRFSLDDLMAMRSPVAQGLALAEALKTADAETCGKWLEILEKHPHRGIRATAGGLIMERWTALDPAGAIAAAGEDKERKGSVFRQWAHHDPAAALAAAGKDFHNEIRQGIMETDPEHAASRWKEIAPDSPFPITTLEFALRGQVKKDPEGAMRQVPDGDDYQTNSIRADLFKTWMDGDADAAFQFAEGHADSKTRSQLLGEFARRFPERLEPVLASLEGGEKSALALDIAKGKAAQDPVAAARWLQSQTRPEEFAGALTEFARSQRSIRPEQFGALLAMCPDAESREKLVGRLTSFGMTQGVADWLKAQAPGSLSPAQQALALEGLPAAESSSLMPESVSIPRNKSDEILRRKASGWNPADPSSLGAELSALPPSLQAAAAGIFLNQPRFVMRKEESMNIVKELPAGTVAEIFSSLSPAAQGEMALSFAWKQQSDPAAAARTLAASQAGPDNPATAAVYESVARNWAGTDAPAAAGWIQSLPAGSPRDAAALALIESQAVNDPAGAAAWARTLQDPVAVMRAQQILNPDPGSSGQGTAP